MEVKVTRDLKVVEYKSYVAKDGNEFDSEKDCLDYERTLREQELEAKLNDIEENKDAYMWTPLDGSEYVEYHDYRWFRPKNMEEVEILNEVFKLSYLPLDEAAVNHWICLEITDDDAYDSCLDNSLDHIQAFLDKFGYDVTITKR